MKDYIVEYLDIGYNYNTMGVFSTIEKASKYMLKSSEPQNMAILEYEVDSEED